MVGRALQNEGCRVKGAELAKSGFDVLLIDYRGYRHRDGSPMDEQSLNADGEAAYDYLLRQRGVKPEKLALYGQSPGTTVAIDVTSRRGCGCGCGALIVESGFSSASEMGRHSLPMLPRWLHSWGGNRFESSRKIAGVSCLVLVAHGAKRRDDPGCPRPQALRRRQRTEAIAAGRRRQPQSGGRRR